MARSKTVDVGGAVAVEGLSAAASGLRRVNLGGAVSAAHRKVVKPVLEDARGRWRSQRIKPTKATKIISGQATQSSAALRLRYGSEPTAAGVEYGSKRFRQFRPWSGNQYTKVPGIEPGYVLTPAITDKLDTIARTYADTLEAEIRSRLEGT